MIPILYPSTETAFRSNGLGRLRDCISCHVVEERNGKYECTFIYPITGRMYSKIEIGCYIACTHDDKGDVQAFQIYRRSAPINGQVTFNAHHISYQLSNVIVRPFTASSIMAAFAGITANAITDCAFTFETDKTTSAPFSLEVPRSARAILGGTEGSILDVFGGGEYTFDMFKVKLQQHRGMNRGVTIRYGKNLKDITQVNDGEELHNAVVPFWYGMPAETEEETDPGDVLVMCDPPVVAADGVTDPVPVILDLSTEFQEPPTPAELRTAAESYLTTTSPWIPSENIKVDFIQLWQTSQYENVKNLQRLSLCDSVSVIYPALGVQADNVKIIKVDYNVLLERYDTMELGEPQQSYAGVITADLNKSVSSQIKRSEDNMRGFFDSAIETATELLTGGAGGHLYFVYDADGKPQELLILDTDDINTATNILRINLNGIGFSSNGGQTYGTAWTLDGNFVADYITTGTLKAITIQGPTALTFWDLATGIFQSYGTKTLTSEIETRPGTKQTVTYTVETKTRLDGGEMTVDGKRTTDTETTEYADYGLQSDDVDYDFYEQIPSDLPRASLSYPHGGMVARGDRVEAFGGSGIDQHIADLDTIKYRPKGTFAPDYVELGRPDDPITTGGVAYTKTPDRNILRLSGGWVERREAILYKEYMYNGADAQGTVRTFYDPPVIHRPAWEVALTDFLYQDGGLLVVGWITTNKTKLQLFIPLNRPIGEDVLGLEIEFVLHRAFTASGTGVVTSDQNCWMGSGELEIREVTWGDLGIRVKVENVNSPSWSAASNNGMVFCEINDLVIKPLDHDPYAEE